jgi:hypothetical protein
MLIRLEVRSDMTRTIPDTTINRCVACHGVRLIALTFPGVRQTTQSERGARPSTKCVTCGARYVGTQPLPVASGLISVSDRDDANKSASWGPALAKWALRMERQMYDELQPAPPPLDSNVEIMGRAGAAQHPIGANQAQTGPRR